MRIISTFPSRSGHSADLLKLEIPGTDYPNVRVAAAKLLRDGHIADIFAASYARLLVDEYSGLLHSPACNCSIRRADIADMCIR